MKRLLAICGVLVIAGLPFSGHASDNLEIGAETEAFALRVEYDIRHQSFGWIRDLAGPDRIVDFGRNVLSFLGDKIPPGGLSGINLLHCNRAPFDRFF